MREKLLKILEETNENKIDPETALEQVLDVFTNESNSKTDTDLTLIGDNLYKVKKYSVEDSKNCIACGVYVENFSEDNNCCLKCWSDAVHNAN